MSRALWKFLLVIAGIFALAGCATHYYCCTTYGSVVLVPPRPMEAAYVPQGYVQCMNVPAGWHGTYWMPEHKVCQYQREEKVVVWVGSYWRCDSYRASAGVCTDWRWMPGHWAERTVLF